MSNLYQRRHLSCPYNRARELLASAVEAAATSGDAELLRLCLPISDGASLSKDVMVTFEPGKDPMHFDQPWTVRWEATAGGLYPGFRGTLAVRADDTYGTSMLELSGVYEPPLGVIGAAFDAVVGSRIAHGTARELLRSLGTTLEDQYRRSEASKAAHL